MELPVESIRAVLSEKQMKRYEELLESKRSYALVTDLDPAFEEAVRNLGWKICKRCHRGIERRDGCGSSTLTKFI